MINANQAQLIFNKKPSGIWAILDVLFPPFCCNCALLGFELCPECFNKIEILNQQKCCPICGDYTENGGECFECQSTKPLFDQLRSWGIYTDVLRNAIQKIKFDRGLGLIHYFTASIVEFIKGWGINIDLISPVPLGKSRLHARGYNQVDLIAKPVSKKLGVSYHPKALIRVRETNSQVGLNAFERKSNVLNAFKGDAEINNKKSILVIDDITTTGSTLNECAKALRTVGAEKVYCFTLARTISSHNQN